MMLLAHVLIVAMVVGAVTMIGVGAALVLREEREKRRPLAERKRHELQAAASQRAMEIQAGLEYACAGEDCDTELAPERAVYDGAHWYHEACYKKMLN